MISWHAFRRASTGIALGFLVVAALGINGCSQKVEQNESKITVQQQREALEKEQVRQAILSNVKQLEQQKDLFSQKMIGRQQKILSLEIQESQLETDLRAYNGKVESFMMAHVGAIACMGAVGAALDESNQYSKDAKDVAATATVVCGIAVVTNSNFREEVFSVTYELTQADSYAKNLKSQITAIQSEVYRENNALEKEKSEVGEIASSIQKYQSQLKEM